LPSLFVEGLKQKAGFSIIKERYELLARGDVKSPPADTGKIEDHYPSGPAHSDTMMTLGCPSGQGYTLQCKGNESTSPSGYSSNAFRCPTLLAPGFQKMMMSA
jgi:hypothetical protein